MASVNTSDSFAMKILVLSDEPDSAHELASQLSQVGNEYAVKTVSWPTYSSPLLEDTDLILIHVHNIVNCKQVVELRQITKLPLFLISAIGDEEFLAQLYASGVDDYLALPLSYPLLFAKLRVWQRWVVRLASVLYN